MEMIYDVFKEPYGPSTIIGILDLLPIAIFVRGVEIAEREEDRETTEDILRSLKANYDAATHEDRATRRECLDAALEGVTTPFHPATNVPSGNYYQEERALNNPQPANEVLPIEFGIAQLQHRTAQAL
jgi:hypothetical protein